MCQLESGFIDMSWNWIIGAIAGSICALVLLSIIPEKHRLKAAFILLAAGLILGGWLYLGGEI